MQNPRIFHINLEVFTVIYIIVRMGIAYCEFKNTLYVIINIKENTKKGHILTVKAQNP